MAVNMMFERRDFSVILPIFLKKSTVILPDFTVIFLQP